MINKLTIRGIVAVFLALALPLANVPAASQFAEKVNPAKEAEEAKEHAAINADLESVAKELATLLKHPGFRGQLRGEINGSKALEGVIEIDKFLAKVAKNKKGPPGLAKARGASDKAIQKLKASPAWALEGIDLYFPVREHNAKWKGNEDLLVAFAPVNNEAKTKVIVGFSVKTGQKVTLDPAKPPVIPVLIVAAEEHDSHEMPVIPRGAELTTEPDFDLEQLPEPDAVGKEPPDKPVQQEGGNSYVGLRKIYIRDMKEPWYSGRPELKVFFGQQRKTMLSKKPHSYCAAVTKTWNYWPLHTVDKERYWETPSTLPTTASCGGTAGAGNVCFYFDNSYSPKMVIFIYEQDGGTYRTKENTLYPGTTCSWGGLYSKDDYVDSAYMYRSNFGFNVDYYHDMDNAYVAWHKVH